MAIGGEALIQWATKGVLKSFTFWYQKWDFVSVSRNLSVFIRLDVFRYVVVSINGLSATAKVLLKTDFYYDISLTPASTAHNVYDFRGRISTD